MIFLKVNLINFLYKSIYMTEHKYTSNDYFIVSVEEQTEIVTWLRENYLRQEGMSLQT